MEGEQMDEKKKKQYNNCTHMHASSHKKVFAIHCGFW